MRQHVGPAAECRAAAEGLALSGTALVYGDVATIPGVGRERFEPGAFGDLAGADVILDRQHRRDAPLARTNGGGLILTDGPDALRIQADLPETAEAADAVALVRAGVLRGLSVLFQSVRERVEAGVRVIERARLVAIGVVDRAAYPASTVEARQVENLRILATLPYGADEVVSNRTRRRKTRVRPFTFRHGLADAERDVILNVGAGSSARPLATKRLGTLTLRESRQALTATATGLPDVTYAADALTLLRAGLLIPTWRYFTSGLPGEPTRIDPEPGNPGVDVEVVSAAILTSIHLLPRSTIPGATASVERERPERRARRRRVWL